MRNSVGRQVVRTAAVVAVIGGHVVGAALPASAENPPDGVTSWFATQAAREVEGVARTDPGFVPAVEGGATVTFGAIAPKVVVNPPGYDLGDDTATGPTDYASTASLSGEWCAQVVADGVTHDVVLCASESGDGAEFTGMDQLGLVPAGRELPSRLLRWQGGWFGVTPDQVTALDERALVDVPTPVGYEEFVTAVARRAAEYALVGDGTTGGGAPPLFSSDEAQRAAWEQEIQQAREASGGWPTWALWLIGGAVVVVGVAGASVVSGRRRARTGAGSPSS